LGCGYLAAVSGVERVGFCAVMRGFARPPFFLTGKGSREQPWQLRTLAVKARIDSRQAPVVVSIGDDAGGVFQSSPPSPVDLAVVLKNLQRLGAKQAAIAAVMAWEKPDPVALKGLEIVLDDFQMVIHAAPLSRGTVRQAMPPAFRRGSLAPDAIQGDLSKLPIVNRVAVPDVIFGGERALAGFTSVDDAATHGGSLQLLVRWEEEERVVLAFPLLAVLARYDLPVAGIHAKLGEFLQLGPGGPVVPIDENGRMALPAKPVSSRADVSAEALIEGTPEIFPAAPGLIVLRDDQSSAPRATRQFSATLASAIASIGSDAGLGSACTYRRLSAAAEWGLLLAMVAVLALIAGLPRFQRLLVCGLLAAACVAAQWLVVGLAQVWLPGIALLAAILAGAWVMAFVDQAPRVPRVLAARPAPDAAPTPAARATGLTNRTFRSVTIWKEPLARPALEAPSASDQSAVPPPDPATAVVPLAAEPAQAQRKTAVRKASSKKVPLEGSLPLASPSEKRSPRKSPAKPAAERKTKASKAQQQLSPPAVEPPPEP